MTNRVTHKILALALICLPVLSVMGQEKAIQGKLTVFDSIPVVGAKIKAKGSKKQVLSDDLGVFTIDCQSNDKLKISAVGFTNQNIEINEQTEYLPVEMVLKEGSHSPQVAIEYGHILDRENFRAAVKKSNEITDYTKYNNISEILRTRFLDVKEEGDMFIIEGQSTSYGNSPAFLILDGREVDRSTLFAIPMSEIKDVNVVKGTSGSIYGLNGAIIVKTKTGNR